MPQPPATKTLLLGIGNPILADDGVGLRLAADAKTRLGAVLGLDVIDDCTVGGLNLLDVVAGYDRLIVLDSIKTGGGVPGAWYRFTGDALRETMNLRNVHDANFATALELGRRLGMRVPAEDERHIFAVEVADNLTFSTSLSPELEEAYPEYAAEIIAEIRALLSAPLGDRQTTDEG